MHVAIEVGPGSSLALTTQAVAWDVVDVVGHGVMVIHEPVCNSTRRLRRGPTSRHLWEFLHGKTIKNTTLEGCNEAMSY